MHDQMVKTTREDIGTVLATVLGHIAAKNKRPGPTTPFLAPYVPKISLVDYLRRMQTYMHCTRESFLIAAVLITRLEEVVGKTTLIVPLTAHRLVLTAVVIAIKIHDDTYAHNTHYAAVGGVSLAELNELEKFFLLKLKFRTFVTNADYEFCRTAMTSLYASLAATTAPVSMVTSTPLPAVDATRHASISSAMSDTETLEEFTYGTKCRERRRSSLVNAQ